MSETQNTPVEATVAAQDAVTVSPVVDTAPAAEAAPAEEAAPQLTLLERAEAIVHNLEGVAFQDAILILHHVADRITGGATREASIVKTKFEEAILWVRRHFEAKTFNEAVAAANAAPKEDEAVTHSNVAEAS